MNDKEQINDTIQAILALERLLGDEDDIACVAVGGFNICEFPILVKLINQLEDANGIIANFALEDSLAYDWEGDGYRGRRIARAFLEACQPFGSSGISPDEMMSRATGEI